MNDYLWDRSGEPDPEVMRLERMLGRYGHARQEPPELRPAPRRRRTWLALAASILVAFGLLAAAIGVRFQWSSGTPWEIVSYSGSPMIDGQPVGPLSRLGVGSVLRTPGDSTVTVRVARIGELDVASGSDLTLLATGRRRHRVELRSGQIAARVWAPPFTFGVETPAGLASDLGCAFTLGYQEDRGVLRVTSGWVDFDGDFRSALVPAGAVSELDTELGPGSPYRADAAPAFRDALREYDRSGDPAALEIVLRLARPRDAVTLIHLLEQGGRRDRATIYDRLAALAPPPSGVTRAAVLERDLRALDRWRRSLGLGGVKQWWRQWRDALPD